MANNPYVSKVQYGNNVLIDLTTDTVASNKMLSGTTAHDKSGAAITGNIASKAAETFTPTTSDIIIAAGKYLSGAQTIKGDANLTPANIAKDVTIFGVTGTHEGGGGAIDTVSGEVSGSYGRLVYTFPSNGIYLLVNQHTPQADSSSAPNYRAPRFMAVICDDTGAWTSDCVVFTIQYAAQLTAETWSGKTMTVSGGSWYRFSSVTFDVYRCGDIPS